MRLRKTCFFFFLWLMALSVLSMAQVRLTGDISGTVSDEKGIALPGVAITLTGEKMFQSSMTAVTSASGEFRFLNLNPGTYQIECALPGFNSLKISPVSVSVGKTTPIIAKMMEARVNEEVVVRAEAPLIDTKAVQVSTNFSSEVIQNLPTSRNFQDLVESTPAINDFGAYGSGGRVDDGYYKGSSSNAYLLNGVDISDPSTGTTWINPNYDTIEEVQVVGAGATAEYGNYTGAVLNVITKTGSNKFHGGISSFFTNKGLTGDNSSGIEDLKPEEVKYNSETTAYFSGPLVKERLFFFLAGGYTAYKNRAYAAPDYARYKAPHFQANLNWLVDSRNTLTLMFNADPIDHANQGLMANSSPDIAFSRVFRSTVWNANWRSLFSSNSIMEVRYAGFLGKDKVDPFAKDVPQLIDYTTMMVYGSAGSGEDNKRTRHDVNATFTRYLDGFLGMSHELKLGLEFEKSRAQDYFYATGDDNSMFMVMQLAPEMYYVMGYSNYYADYDARVTRLSGFIQDNIRIGRKLTANIGLRFDSPKLKTPGLDYSIAGYTDISPRLGFSYDLTGDARNVLHVGLGRYYDKMTTGTFASCLPGVGNMRYYETVWDHAPDLSPEGLAELPAQILTPDNFVAEMPAGALQGVDPDIHGSYSDILNIRFDRELTRDLALSLEYIHRWDRDLLNMVSTTEHTYSPAVYTDPWQGKTVMVWERTDSLPDNYIYSNSNWAKRNHDFAILTLNKRDNGTWSMMASATYQNSRGNIDNQYASVGGQDGDSGDPNYLDNPLVWGNLRFDRTWQFKVMGTYHAPWGINLSGDVHVLSGLAWETQINSSYTGYDLALGRILLEQRGSNRTPWTWYFNARVAKEIRFGRSKLEFMADVMNIFNRANAAGVAYEPYALFPISGESAYGKVFQLSTPIQTRVGVRWAF